MFDVHILAAEYRSRISCAAAASALRIGHSGILLSHSIKRRNRTAARDDDLVKLPYRIGDGTIVAVDQKALALIVALLGMAGKMDFAHLRRAGNSRDNRAPHSRDSWQKRKRC